MRASVVLLLALLLSRCGEEGTGPQLQKVVPNEARDPVLEPVPDREKASGADLLAFQRIPKTDPDEPASSILPLGPDPTDLTSLSPPERKEAAKTYRRTLFEPLPITAAESQRREPEPGSPQPRVGENPDQARSGSIAAAARPPEKVAPRPGGGRFFQGDPAAASATALNRLMPPGSFIKAELIGNAAVSLAAPVVWVSLFDAEGHHLGRASGTATLHRVLKDRALLHIQDLYLDDGQRLRGSFSAYELDLSEGLRGTLERQSFSRFLYALVETFLGALSLEVDTGNDSFANYFRFQFATRLMDQARDRLKDLDLQRVIHLPRGTRFWLASVSDASFQQNTYAPEITSLTQTARQALNETLTNHPFPDDRQQKFKDALRQWEALQPRLNTVNP